MEKRPRGRPRVHANQAERQRAWRQRHPELSKQRSLEYQQANPGIVNARVGKARARRRKAVVPWSDIERIRQFYIDAPEGQCVDHVIPLHGRTVTGLHVSWNLQYLTGRENSRKANKFNQDEASAAQHAFTLSRIANT